ncbi:hydrophobic protein LTI6A-like [Ananas comosus]|uniref:Hydrophobic protein LTI6A-like n=1 Tax=Ananas comosus TaxID=4615 RepID=A0A6P5GPX7_ANACO|nr:hydrophobic protein LTI6A-like [Ananas comosus]
MASEGTLTCVEILLAIFLPPLGVFLKYECKVEFWICLLLTFLMFLPGMIYAIWVITK